MSTDYSFYALLCGYMPRPEGVQKRRTRVLLFFCINTLGLALIYGGIRQNQTPPQHLLNLSEPKEILREPKIFTFTT